MKNQYFGDNRDLFKYDLVSQIIQTGLVDHFTLIPMLTKGPGDEDNRREAPGRNNNRLVMFLDECRRKEGRNINQLEKYFKDVITIYKKDDEDKYFSHGQREQYFEQVPDKLLKKSLVLVDPDTGLEVNKPKKEHILYCEVKKLYGRMNKSSILMIFDVFRRENHESYLNRISKEIKNKVMVDQPIYIHDGKTIFFFLTKYKSLGKSLREVINDYGKIYPKLMVR